MEAVEHNSWTFEVHFDTFSCSKQFGALHALRAFHNDLRIILHNSQVVKWCSQIEGGGAGDEEGSSNHDVKRHAQLVAQLLHIEWTDAKSKLVQEMNEREAKNYENLLGVRHTVGDITFA